MKRFYCTECKKFKRVRRYPSNVVNTESPNVSERKGVCNFHSFTSAKKVRRVS